MEILVLGGTAFLSRAVAELGVARGHNVTTFNRGQTGPPVAGARAITGDRTDPEDLAELAGASFDLVFDTGYLPEVVKASAELLEPSAGHYAFTSSINAYSGWPAQADYHQQGVYDGDPDAVGEQVPDGLDESAPYGWRKAGAERAVLRAFGEHRCSILRAGLIVGPQDRVGRLPWWLDRLARGGPTLVPGAAEDELRLIDARDIAEFALLRPVGTFEVTGPAHQINRGQLLAEAREVTGSDAEFIWVGEDYLVSAGVEGWTELPLWVPAAEAPGLWAHDTSAAEAAGLACRSVRDTLLDTWDWMRSIEGGWKPAERTPGLAPERERELLAGWTG
ncbi:MAG: NAD-dependent epimerase/dehydratase family protein [Jatrophihabitantaceae bacterium]